MLKRFFVSISVGALLTVSVLVSPAAGANLLANPGFESGLTGWAAFNNTYSEAANPHSGARSLKMFGNWSGPWNAAGAFQQFPASAGQVWDLQGYGMNSSGDALLGQNFGLLKISWRDAGNNEISGIDSQHITSATPTDQWQPLQATGAAPAGTASVQLFALFLQPNFEGGSAWIDDVSATPEPASGALLGLALLTIRGRRRRR